ncbi:MAG: hypothetical protein ACLFMX_02660, partial [Halobacteriales archaeon]
MTDIEDDYPDRLADVEFPTPREACLDSVEAVHRYLHEVGRASRADIVAAMRPEDEFEIGVSAAQALGELNDVDGYREWWWTRVVAPGLEALSDVEPDPDSPNVWRVVDADGSQEWSRRDEDDSDGDSPVRRARELERTARGNPDAVEVAELARLLSDPMLEPPGQVAAIRALK